MVVSRGRRSTLDASCGLFFANRIVRAATCLVSILWFSFGIAVSMGKLQNLSFLRVAKLVVMSSCAAGVAPRDILMCLQTCQKSFCVAGAIL